MWPRLLSLLEGILLSLFRPRTWVFIALFLLVAGTAYVYWDGVVASAYIKGFVYKTIPKAGAWVVKNGLALLVKAFAKKYGRTALVGLLWFWLDDAEKARIKESQMVAILVAKHYFIDKPRSWWRNKDGDGKIIAVSIVIGVIVLLVTLPFLGASWITLMFIFFLDLLRIFVRALGRVVWNLALFFFRKIGATNAARFIEQLIISVWKIFSNKYGDVQTFQGLHARREQLKRAVLVRAEKHREKTRERLHEWNQARKERKTRKQEEVQQKVSGLRAHYIVVALIVVSLTAYSSTLT